MKRFGDSKKTTVSCTIRVKALTLTSGNKAQTDLYCPKSYTGCTGGDIGLVSGEKMRTIYLLRGQKGDSLQMITTARKLQRVPKTFEFAFLHQTNALRMKS